VDTRDPFHVADARCGILESWIPAICMLPAVRTSRSGRLGAVLVALALTGAPALAAGPERSEHQCLCRHHAGKHECECARCHEATRKQQARAADAQEPPCHRAAAKDKEHASPRQIAGGPCMTGMCGGPEQQRGTPLTPLDAFTLPLALAPGGTLPPAGSVQRPSQTQREAPSAPETPPPRAGRAPADQG
jgi:hypothetical protein